MVPKEVAVKEFDSLDKNGRLFHDVKSNKSRSKTGNKDNSNLVSNLESTKGETIFKPSAAVLSTAKKEQIEEYFAPQLPVPGDNIVLVAEISNVTQKNLNCTSTSQNASEPCVETLEHAPQFEQATLTKVVILFVIAGLSFIGNIATLTSILRTGRQNTSTVYILLVQLAISDLLVATFCLLTDALWKITVQWYGGNILCKAVKFMQMFSLYLSTYVLVLIGFDRLCAIRFPMARARAKHYVRNGIVCIWISSAVFSSPQRCERYL
ncbi:gonadotropin-releasing hormone receptor [Caerostris darwini]|uniref:Gonadotropin-releasing hormone receptor n=1 Tax=Caerostris darwini TaxID=1538125 RepID=A0AAV4M5Z0_9ARAC|nr:gonadotropin-releasing hormone receptor [Caerostris darwini]